MKRLQWGEREDGLEEIWKKEDGKREEKGDWGRGERKGRGTRKEREDWAGSECGERRTRKDLVDGARSNFGSKRAQESVKKGGEEEGESGGRGDHRKPFLPHGLEGLALVGTREKRRESLSPCG